MRRYQLLKNSFQESRPANFPLDFWLRQIFAEHLALVLTTPEEQSLVQTLTDTALRFRQSFPQFPPQEFLVMIRSGLTATRGVTDPDYRQLLVVGTPLAYLGLGLSAKYQFWFDITSTYWMRSTWRPLYNHRVLTPEWNHRVLDPEQDLKAQQQILAKTLLNLCCHCHQGLYLVRSSFNIRGEENPGTLEKTILTVLRNLSVKSPISVATARD